MSMSFISALLILSFAAGLLKKTKTCFIFSALTLLLFFSIGSGVLPKILLNGLQTRARLIPEWKEHNAIVVLGSGANHWPQTNQVTSSVIGYSRIFEGARLYNLCIKSGGVCKIFLTGGDPSQLGESEAHVMARELMEINIPESDLVLEQKSSNTFQNAQFTSELLRSDNSDLVILVSSGFHLNRSLAYFAHFNVSALGSPADHTRLGFTFLPRSAHFLFFDIAFHEHAGLLRYWFYNLLGWNPAVSEPGSV